ncbi:Secreted protein [Achromobacter aegrifaciens]
MPAMPPSFCAAIGMAVAVWYWVNLPRSPAIPMEIRVSSAFCSSSGSDTFSTVKLSSLTP